MMRIQQVRKVRRQRRPGYPTRPEVTRDPELLRRHIPSAWKKSAQVTAALSILLASAHAEDSGTKEKAAKVAPIFDHGDGRGHVGCVAINPPRLLSEEDALKIIAEEAGKASLVLTLRNVPLQEVKIHHGMHARQNKEAGVSQIIPGGIMPLEVDLADKDRRVVVEFVSRDDDFTFGGTRDTIESSRDIDFRGIAKLLAAQIADADKTSGRFYGGFYDPAVRSEDIPFPKIAENATEEERKRAWDQYNQSARKAGDEFERKPAELLRAQVRDFIEWLKGQGAI
jgi:hypothetical protein